MSDSFEFDDDDDVLLNAFCTPPSENASPEKHFNEENDTTITIKKPKLDERTYPVIKFPHDIHKASKRSTPLKNNSLANVSKRIFPGPAGILFDENQTDICSQDTSSFFQDGPWEEMSKDFKISMSLHLCDKFNIAWIKKEATANKFVNQKAPFLAGILLSLEVSEGHTQKSINITLKDLTGSIQGTILQTLYEEYASHITLGSVLVLHQFGVLSCTCDKCDNHHLTITPKNLGAIYSGKEKIVIKQVDPAEVLKEYCQRKKDLELAGTHKNFIRNENLITSVSSSPHRNVCTYSTYRNVGFQNPCGSRNISPSIVNKTLASSENIVQNTSSRNENFHLPKIKVFGKTLDTTMTTELHVSNSPIATTSSSPSGAPKKSFTFKKANTSQKNNLSHDTNDNPLSGSSTVSIIDNLPNSQNSVLNFGELDSSSTKKDDNENVSMVKIGTSQVSVKVDNVEHEKIWKDLLEDVDVTCLFNDEF